MDELKEHKAAADINPDEYYPDDEPDVSLPERFRRRIFKMVSVGVVDDRINQLYDIISIGALLINLLVTILDTFDGLHEKYALVFDCAEAVTIAFFAVDYVLRLYTANCLYPYDKEIKSILKYIFSFTGIVDLLSFLPYYLPAFFPAGAAVFKMFRVARILRLFRINAYYDSLNVITDVLLRKKQQLLSSLFIILVLMVAASLCMYSIENRAQPEVFSNAFSGIWWAASTLLTVGYGDIYPVTALGKALGIFIAFLGVGIVAIPTGIISAGFVEQYSKLQSLDKVSEEDVNFIKIKISPKDKWTGRKIADLDLPEGAIIAVIQRGAQTIVPRGNIRIAANDVLILGAQSIKGERPVYLKEATLSRRHKWTGQMIRDLDISRQTVIIMIKRGNMTLIPKGNLILMEGDKVIMYSHLKGRLSTADETEQEL